MELTQPFNSVSKSVILMKTIDTIDELKEISNRGRVAFAICCLESAITVSKPDQTKWQPVFEELWKFCSSDMTAWKERFSPGLEMDIHPGRCV
jgi:hypothetical protein